MLTIFKSPGIMELFHWSNYIVDILDENVLVLALSQQYLRTKRRDYRKPSFGYFKNKNKTPHLITNAQLGKNKAAYQNGVGWY